MEEKEIEKEALFQQTEHAYLQTYVKRRVQDKEKHFDSRNSLRRHMVLNISLAYAECKALTMGNRDIEKPITLYN